MCGDDREWCSGWSGYDFGVSDRNCSWSGKWILCNEGQTSAIYCDTYYNDGVSWGYNDIPIPVILLVLIFVGFYFLLNKTTFGRAVYATGSNWKCAKLAGINIHKTKIIVYAISGFMAALSGLILLSRLGSAQPTLGEGYELDAIAAVALGGTSMSGGRGKIYGTFIGVLIIAVLNNGLNILGVSSYYQDVIKGLVILVAVLSDRKR